MNPQHTELTVIIKNEDSRYRQKFNCYQDYVMQPQDPWIQACIEDAKKNFHGEAEEIEVRASLIVQ